MPNANDLTWDQCPECESDDTTYDSNGEDRVCLNCGNVWDIDEISND